MTRITPKQLWLAADYLNSVGHDRSAEILRDESEKLKLKEEQRIAREQADEQRIDELAQTFADARYAHRPHFWFDWDKQNEVGREGTRVGIRAVLTKLDEEKTPGVKIPDGAPLYFGRWPVNPWKVSPGTWTLPDYTPKPRQWDSLSDVPEDVMRVYDKDGVTLVRAYSLGDGHQWVPESESDDYKGTDAPYTEVLGGAL